MNRFLIIWFLISSNVFAEPGYNSLGFTYEQNRATNENTKKMELTQEFIKGRGETAYMWRINLGENSYGANFGVAKNIGINLKYSLGLDYSPNILEEDRDRLYWTPRLGFDWAFVEVGFGEHNSFDSKELVDGRFSYFSISIPFWVLEKI